MKPSKQSRLPRENKQKPKKLQFLQRKKLLQASQQRALMLPKSQPRILKSIPLLLKHLSLLKK